jgi:hypothetical protein
MWMGGWMNFREESWSTDSSGIRYPDPFLHAASVVGLWRTTEARILEYLLAAHF